MLAERVLDQKRWRFHQQAPYKNASSKLNIFTYDYRTTCAFQSYHIYTVLLQLTELRWNLLKPASSRRVKLTTVLTTSGNLPLETFSCIVHGPLEMNHETEVSVRLYLAARDLTRSLFFVSLWGNPTFEASLLDSFPVPLSKVHTHPASARTPSRGQLPKCTQAVW